MATNDLNKLLGGACVIASLVLATACTVTPRGSVNTYSGNSDPRATQMVEGNPMFAANIEIPTKSIITTRKNDLMVVQFDIANKSSQQMGFQWTVEWYDRQGLLVQNTTRHWEPMRLAGKASETVSIIAPTREAESWKLQIGSRDEVQ
jgi:uncharacterized protein YcfL